MGLLNFFQKKDSKKPPVVMKPCESFAPIPDFEDVLPEGSLQFWDGTSPKHVYRCERGYDKNQCPKCGASLETKYVGLIYAAKDGSFRQSASPCASICDACSVAVIDEKLPRAAANHNGVGYIAPFAVFSLKRPTPQPGIDKPQYFETYEGHKVTIVLNSENEQLEDIFYVDELKSVQHSRSPLKERKLKEKRKNARNARKQNRKK